MIAHQHFFAMAFAGIFLLCWIPSVAAEPTRHAVPIEHPRLLGSRRRLQKLARQRIEAYQRMVCVARELNADAHAKMISMALVCAIEQDEQLGKSAVAVGVSLILSSPSDRGEMQPCRTAS